MKNVNTIWIEECQYNMNRRMPIQYKLKHAAIHYEMKNFKTKWIEGCQYNMNWRMLIQYELNNFNAIWIKEWQYNINWRISIQYQFINVNTIHELKKKKYNIMNDNTEACSLVRN